ncbi:metallophosphoesterase [Algibacter miyuki]|uniref:Metallophosphoesterase n=1 Tax=Algibacter miyuki TaxID=1306933 RepID=A0ABV5H2V1_9FLAO|nr:metallophosphoesterase [Algibacter miyuki]MDN3664528.1 metallophosphoesterase [Algibacter miyuki]
MNIQKITLVFVATLVVNACATYKTQYNKASEVNFPDKAISHSFYLIGDAGNSPIGSESAGLTAFKNEIKNAPAASTVLFLGDNIYPKGLPDEGEAGREFAEYQLKIQTDAVKDFKGNAVFIPGNHDWYSDGLKGLKRQEKYVEDALGKNTFLPEDGCPIEKVEISDDVVMIVVDTEWYLTNWDKHPTINDDCDIKTREKFFEELEGLIKKSRGKSTIIAMHHPLYTSSLHGGEYSFKSHLKPLPVLGTLKNVLRETTGVSPADLQNKRYNTLKKRVVTLAQDNEKVIFVSGHDHNLQYLVQDNLHQIISGAGSKSTPTRNVAGQFSSSDAGFARLDVFTDGSSFVRFYSAKKNKVIYQSEVLPSDKKVNEIPYNENISKEKIAAIYTADEVDKSGFYKSIWGDRYREIYGTEIAAPTIKLDTLFGGLSPFRKGGGHQSKSLHLKSDTTGKRYVMRALRKSATVYLQAMAFKDKYIGDQFDGTVTESILLDFYTGSHPYAPFVTGVLSDAVNLYHTNPVIYYIPKQTALTGYNDEFGDALYMIEEHVSDGHGDLESFGFANKIESTDDMLKNLRKDEKYSVDEVTYLRARLFDMVVGDWDRHVDQWRWAEFEDEATKAIIYKPIPRDRDQAFSIMGDGGLMNVATRIIPSLKLMEGFKEDVRNIKGFNFSPYSLDMTLLNKTSKAQWEAQIAFIQKNLTEAVIDEAFSNFPKEIQGVSIAKIKPVFLERIKNLSTFGMDYFEVLSGCSVITGTDKDDLFEIERMPNGITKVTGSRIKNGEKGFVFFDKTYSANETNDLWIYGLDDDDEFRVFGEGDHLIRVVLVGGQNNDIYTVENGKKVTFYDYKSKKSTITTNNGKQKLTDDYLSNVYDIKKLKNSTNQLIPVLGANPDDGFKIGFVNTLTNYGFERNPFSSQHTIGASFYFATSGFDLEYTGEFANVVGNWNLGLNAKITSPNYAINFFGYGNSTPNLNIDDEDQYSLDYNRVKYSTFSFAPSLNWRGQLGGHVKVSLTYEAIEVEESNDRFINEFYVANGEENNKKFVGADAIYTYQNKDNEAFPTMGMQTSLQVGYKTNVDESKGFGYLIPELGFDYKLIYSGQLVLATNAKAHITFGDDFEFYQAANIGANNGLRGYRNERFSGKNAFYQSTDLRLNLHKVSTGLLPLEIGVYGGFDYGRVWIDNDLLLTNDLSLNSSKWNTSLGGGIYANAADVATLNLSAFNSDDGLRIAFKIGFGF